MDCNECEFINLTEDEQNKEYLNSKEIITTKRSHICLKHKVKLFHRGEHPRLIPCDACGGIDFKQKGVVTMEELIKKLSIETPLSRIYYGGKPETI